MMKPAMVRFVDIMKVQSVGIIGFGKFGKLLETMFSKNFPEIQIKIYSEEETRDQVNFFELAEVAECDLVIPSVPISSFAMVIEELKEFLKPDSLVMDVCSVKIHPREVMINNLPTEINILATHPNFGPESFRLNGNSTKNLNFILERVRCSDEWYQEITQMLSRLELNVVEMTAEEHDREIGIPHFVSMFQGLLINRLGIERTKYGAASTQRMFDMAQGVGSDLGIIRDMVKYNPFVKPIMEKMIAASEGIISDISE